MILLIYYRITIKHTTIVEFTSYMVCVESKFNRRNEKIKQQDYVSIRINN